MVGSTRAETQTPAPAKFPGADRLSAWLCANVQGFAGPTTQERVAGGQSNPTWF